jgi:hypothetical protein
MLGEQMASHRLSVADRIKGLRKGIKVLSRKRGGPKWLLPSMKRYLKTLEAQRRA